MSWTALADLVGDLVTIGDGREAAGVRAAGPVRGDSAPTRPDFDRRAF